MKKTMRAAGFCLVLLLAGFSFLFQADRSRAAKEDTFAVLLKMPAPPPPNPLIAGQAKIHDEKFYKTGDAPKDNASIRDLLDYWERQSLAYQPLSYSPEPSDATVSRLMKEIDRKPALLPSYLNLFKKDLKDADFVKEHYDREGSTGVYDKETRKAIKAWLMPSFSSGIRRASKVMGLIRARLSQSWSAGRPLSS